MKLLDRHFERIVVISLAGRQDRRSRCAAHLAALGLSDRIQWFDAVDGRIHPPPQGWNSGGGAWGCHLSHLTIIRQAIQDRLGSVLILEDDAIFSPHASQELSRFLRAVPDDWGQIYLGGQHLQRPLPTASRQVWRGLNVNRTHAYAVNGTEAGRIADYLGQWPSRRQIAHHIDHHLGLAQRMRLWPAYCPTTWFVGQMEAVSDINKGMPDLPERWWHRRRHSLTLPLVAVPENQRLTPELEAILRFPSERMPAGAATLYRMLLNLADDAATHGRLPAWRGSAAEFRRLREIWHNPVVPLRRALSLCPHQENDPTQQTQAT